MKNTFDPTVAERIRKIRSDGPNPLVTIVVPAFNEEKFLHETLRHLSLISTRHAVEIIGVNNASTDNTGRLMEWYGLRVIEEPQKGLTHARVTGIRHARGEIIIQLDADTAVPPTWVDEHVRHFEHGDVVGVSAMSSIGGVHPLVRAWCIGSKIFRGLMGEKRQVLYGIGPNLSYRKSAVISVIDSYESYRLRPEDRHMIRLLQRCGTVVQADGPAIDARTSGRRYASLRSAVRLIGGSIARKILWRYGKWIASESEMELRDIR